MGKGLRNWTVDARHQQFVRDCSSPPLAPSHCSITGLCKLLASFGFVLFLRFYLWYGERRQQQYWKSTELSVTCKIVAICFLFNQMTTEKINHSELRILLFQNLPGSSAFHIGISFCRTFIALQIKLIFTWNVMHQDRFETELKSNSEMDCLDCLVHALILLRSVKDHGISWQYTVVWKDLFKHPSK